MNLSDLDSATTRDHGAGSVAGCAVLWMAPGVGSAGACVATTILRQVEVVFTFFVGSHVVSGFCSLTKQCSTERVFVFPVVGIPRSEAS